MFKDVNSVLTWAAQEASRLCIANTVINSKYRAPRNDTTPRPRVANDLLTGLTSQDRQLQAALIVSTVQKLKPEHAARFIALKYGFLAPTPSNMRAVAINMRLKTDLDNLAAIEVTALNYFGIKVSPEASRKGLRGANKTRVLDALAELDRTSYKTLLEVFIEKGLVQ